MEFDIKKLREEKGLSQQEIADKTGIPRGRINAWEQRGSMPKVKDLKILQDFFDGYKSVYVNKIVDKTLAPSLAVPVYDIEFTAGFTNLIKDSSPQILAMLSIPEVQGCDYVIRAKGDSMADYINDRDWIGIKVIQDRNVIAYSYPHAIVTSDLNLLKFLKKSKDENKIVLHSMNSFYEDFEIEKNKIIELYIIKTVIPFSKIKTFM